MKYFLDTEFIESGPFQPITLMSIGIHSEDGRDFYAVSSEFDKSQCNPWVVENVLPYIFHASGFYIPLDPESYKAREVIKQEILAFVGEDIPDWWGYQSGYDYVMLSQLIGFNDWPDGWPFHMNDVRQEEERLKARYPSIKLLPTSETLPDEPVHHALWDAKRVYAKLSDLNVQGFNALIDQAVGLDYKKLGWLD